MKQYLDDIISRLFEAGPHQPAILEAHDVLYDSLLDIVELHPINEWKAELEKWLVSSRPLTAEAYPCDDDYRESAQTVLATYHVIAARAALD